MTSTDYFKKSLIIMSVLSDMVFGLSQAMIFQLEDGNPYKAVLRRQCERLVRSLKDIGLRTDHMEDLASMNKEKSDENLAGLVGTKN